MTMQDHAFQPPRRRSRGRGLRAVLSVTGLALALMAASPAVPAAAEQSSAGSITIGGSIADTVAGAVSGIATGGGRASGGVQSEHSELSFGDQEGLAISNASGGNHNLSANE